MNCQNFSYERSDCSQLEKIEISLLLEGIFQHYGFDFRNYAFPTVRRRIWHRIQAEGLESVSALQERVLHDSKVMKRLFDDFSINVTEMFRDPEFFASFRQKIIPKLKDLSFIRIWHAGCSTGEEVVSMAIILQEEGLYDKAKIYATDMNQYPLSVAKKAIFPLEKMKKYTKNYLDAGGKKSFSKYYVVDGETANFSPSLIKNVVFAQHNLVTDQSFNEFHVIICRNVLIYFNQELQNGVHNLFHESLALGGFLGLGNKEDIKFVKKGKCYKEIDATQRIFQKHK